MKAHYEHNANNSYHLDFAGKNSLYIAIEEIVISGLCTVVKGYAEFHIKEAITIRW